jgi:hypothetical protein
VLTNFQFPLETTSCSNNIRIPPTTRIPPLSVMIHPLVVV